MGGGLNLDGWNTRRTPPLGHCPRDVINLKNAPTLGHSQAPPPPHCPCDVIHIFQGWNKIAEGWNKIAKGWNKIAERWNKIAKGWNKIAKGWNKIFGMGNWGGGRTTPPTPPGYGPDQSEKFEARRDSRSTCLVSIDGHLTGADLGGGRSRRAPPRSEP